MFKYVLLVCLLQALIVSGCGSSVHHEEQLMPLAKQDTAQRLPLAAETLQYAAPAGPDLYELQRIIAIQQYEASKQPAPPPPAPPAPVQPEIAADSHAGKKKRSKQTASTAAVRKSENRLTIAQLIKKYPDSFLLKAPHSRQKAALTFDDAPDDKYTPQVLDILKKYNVKATFFVVGSRAEKHPGMVKRMVQEGHIVGNHSYNHALFPKLDDDTFKHQINKTDDIINKLTGYNPKFFRPPYGEISESQLNWAASRNILVVNWNVDSQDWRQVNEQRVIHNVMKDVKPGCIILQHSAGGPGQDLSGTVKALPSIIEQIRAKGISLVTLPELLGQPKQK
ncbi:polysaccharide deacetylase family protein [Paenibacillus thalictri]|uniref:Polysaccharide deacetylase family protein n=1 Tax=Paenibacillus thalictri TaxID=2527873 RepID=A0A4Q9DD76_9BACL|nr:polysaccharide deacetylase family protein [Paenibacillus thalictri]TBL67904.1 polysaccharide deacetylase family protein [Paenibacillus thalictri]